MIESLDTQLELERGASLKFSPAILRVMGVHR